MSTHIPVQIGVVGLGRLGNLPRRLMRDGRPHHGSTARVGADAVAFVGAHWGTCAKPVIGVTRGHGPRIHAVPPLAAETEDGRLVARPTASDSRIEHHHGAGSIGRCHAEADMLEQFGDRTVYHRGQVADRLLRFGRGSS